MASNGTRIQTPQTHTDPPGDELPREPTSTTPPPQRHQALIAVLVVLVVTVVVLVAGLGIASYPLLQHKPAPQTPTAAPSPVPTTQPAPPPGPKVVEETALQGLLLSPDEVNAAMGITRMALTETYTAMGDLAGQVSDKACAPVMFRAEAS